MKSKYIQDYKHIKSVSVLVPQDMQTNEIAGKILTNYSDGGVCTSKAFFWSGKFSEGDFFENGLKLVSCGGSGYNKLHSNLCAMFQPFFENYADVSGLDSGLINAWFEQHGYRVHEII